MFWLVSGALERFVSARIQKVDPRGCGDSVEPPSSPENASGAIDPPGEATNSLRPLHTPSGQKQYDYENPCGEAEFAYLLGLA